jgi:hypothetical protein
MNTKDIVVTILVVIGLVVFAKWLVRFLAWNLGPWLVPAIVVGGIVWLATRKG